ncbi:MAG: hypothetical protein ACQEXJ_20245 [Myxococcota bacterium]
MSRKRNITIRVDEDLLREARVIAAREESSVSRMLADLLEEHIRTERGYERARARAMARLEEGWSLGWTPAASRDELHER